MLLCASLPCSGIVISMKASVSRLYKQSDKESRLFKANLINVLVVQTLQILHGLRDIELVSTSSGNLQ